MRTEPFVVRRDVELVGDVYLPAGDGPHPAVGVVHSASGGERGYPFYRHLATPLPAADIAVALFDRRGAG